jgi:hypothetical protein
VACQTVFAVSEHRYFNSRGNREKQWNPYNYINLDHNIDNDIRTWGLWACAYLGFYGHGHFRETPISGRNKGIITIVIGISSTSFEHYWQTTDLLGCNNHVFITSAWRIIIIIIIFAVGDYHTIPNLFAVVVLVIIRLAVRTHWLSW